MDSSPVCEQVLKTYRSYTTFLVGLKYFSRASRHLSIYFLSSSDRLRLSRSWGHSHPIADRKVAACRDFIIAPFLFKKLPVASNITLTFHETWQRKIWHNKLRINLRNSLCLRLRCAWCWRWWRGNLRTRLHVVVVCRDLLTLWADNLLRNYAQKKETAWVCHQQH